MKLTLTLAILICYLFLFFGCSPKQKFYLNKGTGSFGTHPKVQREQATDKKAPVSVPETDRSGNTSTSVSLSTSYSNQPQSQVTASPVQERILQADVESFNRSGSPQEQEIKPEQKISRKRVLLKKKFLAPADDGKPNHKLAKLGFLLVLGGLLLILISVMVSSAVPLLLAPLFFIAGFFTSLRGLSKIKRAPDQYGGKGFAITGLIMSGLILLVSIAFILYILSFAGAFV